MRQSALGALVLTGFVPRQVVRSSSRLTCRSTDSLMRLSAHPHPQPPFPEGEGAVSAAYAIGDGRLATPPLRGKPRSSPPAGGERGAGKKRGRGEGVKCEKSLSIPLTP